MDTANQLEKVTERIEDLRSELGELRRENGGSADVIKSLFERLKDIENEASEALHASKKTNLEVESLRVDLRIATANHDALQASIKDNDSSRRRRTLFQFIGGSAILSAAIGIVGYALSDPGLVEFYMNKFKRVMLKNNVAVTFSENIKLQYSTQRNVSDTIYFWAKPNTRPIISCDLRVRHLHDDVLDENQRVKISPKNIKFTLKKNLKEETLFLTYKLDLPDEKVYDPGGEIPMKLDKSDSSARYKREQHQIRIEIERINIPKPKEILKIAEKIEKKYNEKIESSLSKTNRIIEEIEKSYIKGSCYIAVVGNMDA